MEDPLGMRTLWKGFGQIPEREKKNSYRFTTLLGMDVRGLLDPVWNLHLIKDRSRMLGQRVKYWVNELGADDNGIVDMWLEWHSETGAPLIALTDGAEDDGG